MKKILLILNESHLPQQVIQTAVNIANKSKSILEAVFLNDINALNYGYPFPNDLFLTEKSRGESAAAEGTKLLNDMAKVFRDTCDGLGVEYRIDTEKAVTIKHLIMLSQFSDVMIADPQAESDDYSLKEILADAHCPLLLVPKKAVPAEKIYLVYDGSFSSMHAIKMFSYIFPEYTNLPAQFFHIGGPDMDGISHVNEIKVWASKHFSKLSFELIPANTKKELVAYMKKESEKAVLVLGAYSGSSIARLFLKNMAELIIGETSATIFITHK